LLPFFFLSEITEQQIYPNFKTFLNANQRKSESRLKWVSGKLEGTMAK
jgi:hypothetical protein